jgi:hypothetical protein
LSRKTEKLSQEKTQGQTYEAGRQCFDKQQKE